MAADEIHLGDIGTVLIVTLQDGDTAVDISTAATKQIILRKPNGDQLTKTAVFVTDGSDGQIKYTTVSGDLDRVGLWKIQAYVTWGTSPTQSWKSDLGTFIVYANA